MNPQPTKNLKTIEAKAFVPARDFELSKRFYLALGFDLAWSTDQLAYFRHGYSAFLLQNFHVPACTENFQMHLWVVDADAWWEHAATAAAEFGITVDPPADRPWGMRDFALVDPSGVLWRIGHTIDDRSDSIPIAAVSATEMQIRRRYLDRLDDPSWDDEDPRMDFHDAGLPYFIAAFQNASTKQHRIRLIRIIWQFRSPAALPTLAEALNDPLAEVWKEALDGFVTIGGPQARGLLETARAQFVELDQQERVEWIDEALSQITENLAGN